MKNMLLIFSFLSLSGCGIKVPYFDTLKPQYVCGNYPSPYCQPNSSQQYSKIKSGKDYDGRPQNHLGKSFNNFFQTNPCVETDIKEADIVISGTQTVTGTLKNAQQTKFANKLSADIIALIQMNGVPVPPGVSADISAEVERRSSNTDASQIQLEYKRIDLRQEFMEKHLEKCLAKTSRNLNVSTGISVITVSGTWSSDFVADTLAVVEAKASYNVLSNSAKAEYQQAKQRAMNGQFEPVSFIFAVAHRKGNL